MSEMHGKTTRRDKQYDAVIKTLQKNHVLVHFEREIESIWQQEMLILTILQNQDVVNPTQDREYT